MMFHESEPDMLKIAEQLEILNHHLSKEVTQSMICIEELDDYLRNGWRYIGSVNNSRETFVIVETDERR